MKSEIDSLNKRFGKLLRHARKSNKLNQDELATKAGIAIGTVIGLEKGLNNPSFKMIKLLSEKLDIDPSELFCLNLSKVDPKTRRILDLNATLSNLSEQQLLQIIELIGVFLKPK